MERVVVAAACRTPITKIPGPFTKYDEVTLLSFCFRDVVKRAGIDPSIIDNSYTGCAFQTEKVNIGRKAVLKAGLSGTIPAATINRSCISSMEAMVSGAHDIMSGNSSVVLAGGVEVVSNAPFLINFYRKVARIPEKSDLLESNGDFSAQQMKNYQKVPDYETEVCEIDENEVQLVAESFARKFQISREALDDYAYHSIRKACEAEKNGRFKEEIVPVEAESKGKKYLVTKDQFINPEVTRKDLDEKKAFYVRDGIMTQLNAPSLADCACAMLLMSESKAEELGIVPLAILSADAVVGMESGRIGQAISDAVEKLLLRQQLKPEAIDLWEINETFVPQMLQLQKHFQMPEEKFNVNGGCIALGHPVGASGLRICITLIYEMQRKNAKYGIAAGCAGSGIGQSVLFTRV